MSPNIRTTFSLAVCLCALVASTHQLNLNVGDKRPLDLAPREAKSLLRVRRGWGSFRRKLNPLEPREEREEAREAAQRAAAAERAREARALQDRKDRECPGLCWAPWQPFNNCSQPCGGGGMKTRTRRVKNAQELGSLCAAWVSQRGCSGDSSHSIACNRHCANGGALVPTGCTCTAGWTGKCCDTRITCPDPGKPDNGLANPAGSGLHYATEVQFSCVQGYTLQGPSSRTCTGTGTWTNSIPTCEIVSCGDPGTPANSELEVVSGTGFQYGSSVRVTCQNGYSMTGDSVRRCEANGKWAGVAPSCTQIVCAVVPVPAHGQVVYPAGKTLDAEAQYSCDSGYVLQGVTSRKCQSDRQWTGQQPSCLAIQCDNLSAPQFGSVTHTNSARGKTAFEGTAEFSCQTGYVLQGAQSLTCSGDSVQGKWSGRRPTCEAIDCGNPGSPTNGVREGNVFTFNVPISFKCSTGYYLRGEASARCRADGQWSSTKAECIECPVNRYKEGTDAKTTCDACPAHTSTNGAKAVTSRTNCVCLEGYSGNPGGPCTQITCPTLATPANGIKKSCQNTFNGKCEFDCKEGHIVSVGDRIRTCSENGWSGKDLVCTACPVNTYKSGLSQCTACPDNSGTAGTGNGKSGCVCKTGWSGPAGGPCTDVNECQKSNGGCAQTCRNEVGSYRCECTNAGWVRDDENPKQCNPKNQCTPMQKPGNGGLVCHSHKRTNTERCQVKCNTGFEHITSPNAYEECGPTTNWKWNHEIQGKPILDCVVAWFEEIIIEHEVFYFTDQCSTLTTMQELRIAREFVNFMNSKGVCSVDGAPVCGVGDVSIECGTSRKRSTREKLVVRFSLKSMVLPHMELGDECDANCREDYMTLSKRKMQVASQKAENAIQATIVRPTGSPEEVPTVTFGGISLQPVEVVSNSLQTLCAKGMVQKNSTCVACPSGSYGVRSSEHCILCPIGSFQPQDGQSLCLPCRTASVRGSKSCN